MYYEENYDDTDYLEAAFEFGKIYPADWNDNIPDGFLLVETPRGLYAVDITLPGWIVDQL